MITVPLKRVTLVAEHVLEERLVRELRELGARGHTIAEVRGCGSRGVRASEWEGKNVRIETLVGPEVADRILERLAERYFPHYAVVAYVDTVEVVRGDKYA
jgi:nitrogen regulatory protein PII